MLRGQQGAELQARHLPGVLDHAGRADARGDVGRAAHHAAAGSTVFSTSIDSTPFWNGITTVCLPMIGLSCARGALGVPQLDREHHRVDRPGLGRILEHLTLSRALPCGLSMVRPSLADRLRGAAAGEERHVVPGLLQAGAEVAADAACAPSRRFFMT